MSDAAEWVTAGATLLLFGGVVIGVRQLWQDERNATIERTLNAMREWNAEYIQQGLWYVDNTDDLDFNRERVNRLYHQTKRPIRKGYVEDFLTDLARLAERIEILIRRRLIDDRIMVEHLGYDILAAYYALQDVLCERAKQQNLHYLGFWRLAIIVQPIYRSLPDEEVNDTLATCKFRKPEFSD